MITRHKRCKKKKKNLTAEIIPAAQHPNQPRNVSEISLFTKKRSLISTTSIAIVEHLDFRIFL